MLDIENIKKQIVFSLMPLNPHKIVLFGSYAYGVPTKHSDIDLYIVTNDDFIPQNFKEESEIYLQYSQKIRDLQKIIPIDIITHTKAMYKKFVSLESSFSKEIETTGDILWVEN
ncbi:MAG: nucleotidyltransferase domain-containing protein [Sulfurimonas sp.]|nr:nucleotidyltransferase domain-containing protein [Sulfurimonas sp.]